ncbi:hypothetical protein JCM33374_g5455 [Metschnikowia sp. JCM 33374]|nr:hypothetical protein JCM33374_g5455 [Metschnikowia sp. JCM 33374]
MTSTADEDWSIISSSDYEEDSGSSQSVSRDDGPSISQENYEEDLAAASVTTVCSESQSATFKGSITRVGFSPGSASMAPILDSNVASGNSANTPGVEREIMVTDETPLSCAAPDAPDAPSASFLRAPFSGPSAALSSAVARTAQYLRESDTAIKKRSDQMFHRPIKQLSSGLNSLSSSSSPFSTLTKNVIAILEAQRHLLLYFVIIAAITVCVGGGILGTKAFMSQNPAIASNPILVEPVWGSHFREISVGSVNLHGFTSWTQKTSSLIVGLKDTCSQNARKIWNLALYEDHLDNRTWFERLFHNTRSKKLRFSKFWRYVDKQMQCSWQSMQTLHTKRFFLSMRKTLQIDRVSDIWYSAYGRVHSLAADPETQARLKHWKSSVVAAGEEFVRDFNAQARENWNELCFTTQVGLASGSQILKESFEYIKKSGLEIPVEFKEAFSHESEKIDKTIRCNLAWMSSTIQQFSESFSSIASECQTRIDTVEKCQHLVNSFKAASQSGIEFFSRRLQIAALDVYKMTKNVAASIN